MPVLEAARSRKFRFASRVMLPLAALIGLTGLVGWIFRLPTLRAWVPWGVSTPFIATIFFPTLSASAWLLCTAQTISTVRRKAALVMSATVLLLTLISLLEVTGLTPRLLPRPFGTPGLPELAHPGWLLLSTALLLRAWHMERLARASQWLVVASLVVPWFGLVDNLALPESVTGIPFQGALALLVLGLGVLFAEPQNGPMRVFVSSGPAGVALRVMCPVLLLGPIVLTGLRIAGERRVFFTRWEGLLTELAILTFGFLTILYLLAYRLEAMDVRRHFAEDAMRESFDELRRHQQELAAANKLLEEKYHVEQAMERSLSQLSAQLITLRDEERRKIARDLHDSTGQQLSALSLELFALQGATRKLTPEERANLQQGIDLTDQVSRELRTMSYLLHPPLLDEAGLASALQWLVEGFQKRSGIETSLEIPIGFPRLAADTELALFRVVQESLTNVHRHSGSRTALVRLNPHNGGLRLSVTDFGRGFPQELLDNQAQSGKAGVGLRGMRERIRQLGGSLELACDGTCSTLSVSLPLPELAGSLNAAAASAGSE